MQLKDYYSILALAPSASLDEVKKAYRKLAHQYHPDKKGADPYAAAQFAEIKEAYEILSNPVKKDHYLQQRWYAQSSGHKTDQPVITPVNILKQLLELDKYVSRLDVHRMDKDGLYQYIDNVFSNDTIEKVNTFNELEVNKGIVYAALRSSRHLSYPSIKSLSYKLLKLKIDEQVIDAIHEHMEYSRRADAWNKYKPWLILLVVILLCLSIYFISR